MGIMDWFKKEESTETPTKHKRKAPRVVDFTDSLQVNASLTKGLFFGKYQGLKLASALAYAPVVVPIFFQGFPMVKTEDEQLKELVNEIIDKKNKSMQAVHLMRRRDGTIWIWPKYSSKAGQALWEFIEDESVTDIIRDLETGEPIKIYTQDQMKISTGMGETSVVTRTREFTKQKVTISYEGDIPAGLKSKSYRNIIGILPVAFSCNADANEIRGHSIYGRILSDLKVYHDISLQESQILAKFVPKLSATIKDVEQFATDNGYDDANDFFDNFELYKTDILLNREGSDAEIISAPGMTDAWDRALRRTFKKIVQGSAVPEIAWGLKTEGNNASVEESMGVLLQYVRGDQRECSEPWERVLEATIRLEMIARMSLKEFDFDIVWNDLDAISDSTKSEIFKNFADGITKVVSNAAATPEMVYNLWKMNFPKATPEEYELFKDTIAEARLHASLTKADPLTLMDNDVNRE